MGGLAHPDGEVAIVRAAHKAGVIYMLPTLSSCTLDEMLAAKHPDQVRRRERQILLCVLVGVNDAVNESMSD